MRLHGSSMIPSYLHVKFVGVWARLQQDFRFRF
ncbi:copper chaperone [Moniliophthora roreri]|nr:copper chaperone [Moniliophthora roreri]